jgi:phosphatidylinositol alpha-1,6-mannosyltransferase
VTRHGFAAITLDPAGGGVATAARLIWKVFEEQWPDRSWLITLGGGAAGAAGMPARVDFGARLALAQAVGDCDWICFGHLSAATVQSYLPRPARRPYAVFLHGIEAWRPLSPRRRRVLEEASLLLANSRYTVRRVSEAHPWIGPIRECGLALPDDGGTHDPQWPAHGRARDVLIVGRMSADERYKGHDELLAAWPAVVAHVPDARLVIVGTGDDEARLREEALGHGLGASVAFVGFATPEELSSLYARAAVFAMPSRNEGFGLVYLEAMARGIPCIGSIHDAAADVVEDRVTGFLVDQGDGESLAARLVQLLTDDDLRRRMGCAGRQRLRDRFSYSRFRDRFVALCEASFGAGQASVIDVVSSGTLSRQ